MRQATSPLPRRLHSSGGGGCQGLGLFGQREIINKQITGCFQIMVNAVTEGGDRALLGWMVKEGLIMGIALNDKRRQLRRDM